MSVTDATTPPTAFFMKRVVRRAPSLSRRESEGRYRRDVPRWRTYVVVARRHADDSPVTQLRVLQALAFQREAARPYYDDPAEAAAERSAFTASVYEAQLAAIADQGYE